MIESKNPMCPCGKQTVLTTGAEVYPKLKYLHKKPIYICRPCDAYVGCHPGSFNSLGVVANKEHREAKMKAHRAFDPIWQSATMIRARAYSWLADQMGILKKDCHIGHFSIEDCNRVVEIANKYLAPPPPRVVIRRSADGSEIRRLVSTVETVA